MYVCVCHAVTDKDICKAVDRGACSLFDVQNELPVGSCCGRCQDTAKSVVDKAIEFHGLAKDLGRLALIRTEESDLILDGEKIPLKCDRQF